MPLGSKVAEEEVVRQMPKAQKMARALVQLLQNQEHPGGYWMKPSIREKIAAFKEMMKMPPEEYQNIGSLNFKRVVENTEGVDRDIYGLFRHADKSIHVNPHMGRMVDTLRHEFTHARQFSLPVSRDPRATKSQQLLHIQDIADSLKIPYTYKPIEIHARTVGRSSKPFREAYDNSVNYIVNSLNEGAIQYTSKHGMPDLNKPGDNLLFTDFLMNRLRHLDEATKELVIKRFLQAVITAGGVGAYLSSTKEAQAGPAGVFEKAAVKGTEVASSAAERLIGHKLEGKAITNVLKAQGSWRKILFDDGTQMMVDKQYIHDLSRAAGTFEYVNRFREAGQEAKTIQALKSLKMHEAKYDAHPFFSKQSIMEMANRHMGRLSEAKSEVPDLVFVNRQGKTFTMPMDYAEHLESMGILKILRGREEARILRRYGIEIPEKK